MRRSLLRSIIIVFLLSIWSLTVNAQREINNIYLFDCTGSMKSGSHNIWQPAKDALYGTISKQVLIPGSNFIIIPFGDNPYEVIEFDGQQFSSKKGEIDKKFEEYIKLAKYTHITDVLNEAFQHLDPNKENNIYLLTDGNPNNKDTPQKVAEAITRWCTSHRNGHLFYVALKNGIVNAEIKKAIDACPDAFIVEVKDNIIPQIAYISPQQIYTNIEELHKQKYITFSLPGEYPIKVSSGNNIFKLDIEGSKAKDGRIGLKLAAKNSEDSQRLHQLLEGKDMEFMAEIQSSDPHIIIANPAVSVSISDEIPSKLALAGGNDELKTDGVKWHDSFLWSKAAPEEKVKWDLTPIFSNQLSDSQLKLKFESEEVQDFEAWYNGSPIHKGDIITISPNSPAVLEVQFAHNAKEGKRYFTLSPANVKSIDYINDQPSAQYSGTSLRTEYDVSWSPLKTVFFWLGIILLAALILWFIVLRGIFFPKIRVGKIEMMGPGDFFKSKRLKGARKVVLTNRKRSQNPVSRLFTGEIRYVRADHFSPEISIEPGARKKVKFRSEKNTADTGWDFDPVSSFGQYEQGQMINRKTGEKTKMEFS